MLESLGIAQRTGPMSLQFWVGREGGRITLPPRSAGSDLCVMETIHFSVDSAGTYLEQPAPGRSYWSTDSVAACAVDTLVAIPEMRTYVSDESITAAQVGAVIGRTDEFLSLVSAFPKCADIEGERYLTVLGSEPRYIAGLERPSPSEPVAADDVLIASLPAAEGRGGLSVRFSMVDGEIMLRYVCYYSEPQYFLYEDVIRIL